MSQSLGHSMFGQYPHFAPVEGLGNLRGVFKAISEGVTVSAPLICYKF